MPPPPCLNYIKISCFGRLLDFINYFGEMLFTPDAIRDVNTVLRVAYNNIHPYQTVHEQDENGISSENLHNPSSNKR